MRGRAVAWTVVALSTASLLVGLVGVAPAVATTRTAATSRASGSTGTAAATGNPEGFGLTPGSAGSDSSAATTTTPATVTTTSTTGGGGLSSGDAIAIAIVTALVLGGIAFYVWYDARRHTAQISDYGRREAEGARKGSKAPHKSRKLSPAERRRRKRGKTR